jgi:hypothetical protein
MSSMANIVSHHRCLCSAGKVAGKGTIVIEHLIQVFFKRLDAQLVDNKQVGGEITILCLQSFWLHVRCYK